MPRICITFLSRMVMLMRLLFLPIGMLREINMVLLDFLRLKMIGGWQPSSKTFFWRIERFKLTFRIFTKIAFAW